MNNMILVDPKLIDALEKSTCYSVAHSAESKECSKCDVQQKCATLSVSNRTFDPMKALKPETAKLMESVNGGNKHNKQDDTEETPADKKKVKAPKPRLPEGMPDTKGLSVERLREILEERNGTCPVYEDPGIHKMRLIMAIKKTFK